MSYLRHWKLSRSPFALGASSRGVFCGGTIEEALARSEFLVAQEKRLGIVLGPGGVGKTTFLRHFVRLRKAQAARENLALIDLRSADADLLPLRILQGIAPHQEPPVSAKDCWSEVRDALFAEAAIGHHTVLILDNLHEVSEDFYQAISQLWSAPMGWSMFLSLDDDSIVNSPRWILDQCELKIQLPRWDLGQTADYFEFAIQGSGADGSIFNGQAITRIQELSDGIPRKMVQIAELALVAGAVRRAEKVTAELVDQVCDEFTVTVGSKFSPFWEDQRLNAG